MPGTPPQPDAPAIGVARLRNALDGNGKWAGDFRALANEIRRRFPDVAVQMGNARWFHAWAALEAVRDGAHGAVFAPSGFPAEPYPHTAASAAAPHARFAYASIDEQIVLVNSRLPGDDRTGACLASLRNPAGLLSQPQVRRIWDPDPGGSLGVEEAHGHGRPFQVQFQLAAHYWPADDARALTAQWGRLLPRGSSLAMSVAMTDEGPAGDAYLSLLARAGGWPVQRHAPELVASWLTDAGLVLAGGITDVREYALRPAGTPLPPRQPPGWIAGAVARVP